MLALIIQVFSYIKQVSYFGLVISYKTGQLIVSILKIVVEFLAYVNKNIRALLLVLLEDFYLFTSDVGQRLLLIVTFIIEIIQGFVNCIVSVFENIKFVLLSILYVITMTYNNIFTTITKILTGIGQIFIMLKHLILLIGSGIWFALTIVPLFIVYTCTVFTYYLGCCFDELINIFTSSVQKCKIFINTVYDFVTDVPLESIAGLIAGICIIYVVVKFQLLLYQKLLSVFELIEQNLLRLCARILRSFIRQRQPQPPQSGSESSQTDSSSEWEQTDSSDEFEQGDMQYTEDKVCIICQERNKCILILPCRHVCLCDVCNIRLRNYNRTCPLCRTVVQKTMKVFV